MPQIWPIGGGKGGTGKSFVTGSLGILLAREGYQTLLIDLDLGAANLHTTIGAPNPEKVSPISSIKSRRPGRNNHPHADAESVRECFKKLLIMKDKSSGIQYAVDQVL